MTSPSPINYEECSNNNPFSLFDKINREYILNYEQNSNSNMEVKNSTSKLNINIRKFIIFK